MFLQSRYHQISIQCSRRIAFITQEELLRKCLVFWPISSIKLVSSLVIEDIWSPTLILIFLHCPYTWHPSNTVKNIVKDKTDGDFFMSNYFQLYVPVDI